MVDFVAATEKLFPFDFTDSNTELRAETIADTNLFAEYVNLQLKDSGAKYGIGGYNENRKLYRRSDMFDGEEARSIHLGIDIWGPAGTLVYAPLGGMVHSFACNDNFGDYGATVVLLHQLDTVAFHTLYGHLSRADVSKLSEGAYISRGEVIGQFGAPDENGNWPPHLHFQIIYDMHEKKGDYPGVCKPSERDVYLANCPDADLIVNMMQYV
ncbi:MAG: peptidoglycan DD-metalloendopeptidase family protein [Ferruginibacter sp.]